MKRVYSLIFLLSLGGCTTGEYSGPPKRKISVTAIVEFDDHNNCNVIVQLKNGATIRYHESSEGGNCKLLEEAVSGKIEPEKS